MKKTLLCAAFVAAFPAVATASTTAFVSSNITNLQLWLYQEDLYSRPGANGYTTDFGFGGTAEDIDGDGVIDSANMTLTGIIGFNAIRPEYPSLPVRMTFDLGSGMFSQGVGVSFKSGAVRIDIFYEGDWMPYNVIDMLDEPMQFIAGQPGHLSGLARGPITAGLVSGTLPGLWDGQIEGVGYDRAVSSAMLIGSYTGFYMAGTLAAMTKDGPPLYFSPSEVPVPGAAWLFATSLLGLAGTRRLRVPVV